MRFFCSGFFPQSVHSGPIRDALGPFGILANFHKVFFILVFQIEGKEEDII